MPRDIENTCAPAPEQSTVTLNLPEGVPPLTALYVYAAGSCNLACRHCWIVPKFQRDGDGGPYVELAWVEKAIREAKPLGLRTIKLTGGEPMLHPHFRELVTLIQEANLDIIIETNGTLVDDDVAQFLKDTPHVCFISVSVDGADAETHDALRAVPGSYARALRGIQALVNAGFRPQMICTLHQGNVSQLDEVVAMAERLGCGSVKFNLIQSMGRGERFAEEQGLGIEQSVQLYRHAEKLMRQVNILIYFDVPLAFRSVGRLLKDSGKCTVLNILGLLSGGELSLCGIGTTVPALVYGNIERDDVQTVWCQSDGLVQLREQIPGQLDGICGDCLLRDSCVGACIANSYYVTGRLNAPYFFCDRAEALGLFPSSRKKLADTSKPQ